MNWFQKLKEESKKMNIPTVMPRQAKDLRGLVDGKNLYLVCRFEVFLVVNSRDKSLQFGLNCGLECCYKK